jgi:hypothetical protein
MNDEALETGSNNNYKGKRRKGYAHYGMPRICAAGISKENNWTIGP